MTAIAQALEPLFRDLLDLDDADLKHLCDFANDHVVAALLEEFRPDVFLHETLDLTPRKKPLEGFKRHAYAWRAALTISDAPVVRKLLDGTWVAVDDSASPILMGRKGTWEFAVVARARGLV